LSETSVKNPMVVTEIETAHQRKVKTGTPVIIPIRFGFDGQRRYPLSAYVNRFQRIAWRRPEDTSHLIDQLIEVLAGGPTRRRLKRWQTIFASARRNRIEAIRRMRHWIEEMLQHSLYELARLELELTEKPGAVEWALDVVVQRPYEQPRPLPPGTRISSVFDEQLKQLLILGAPGAGKTTLLLELAQDLLNDAEADEDKSFPVVFHLSSWAKNPCPLTDWLAGEMNERYDIPYKLAQEWLSPDREQILPFLDGLD